MSDKLGVAEAQLIAAKALWKERCTDEAFLKSICTLLHQGFEFGMKYLIEMRGDDPPIGHHINIMLAMLPEYADEHWYKYLQDNFKEITGWYLEQRYGQGLKAAIQDITTAMHELDLFVDWLLNGSVKVDVVPSVEGRVGNILMKLNSTIPAQKLMQILPTSIAILDDEQLFDAVIAALRQYVVTGNNLLSKEDS